MTEFGMVTLVGRSIFLGVSHVSAPRGGAPASPKFSVPLPTPKRFDQSDQIWYGNICGERVSTGFSYTPSRLTSGRSPSVPRSFGTSYMRAHCEKEQPSFAWWSK